MVIGQVREQGYYNVVGRVRLCGSVGGPIKRNKLFHFLGYQGLVLGNGVTYTYILRTQMAANGTALHRQLLIRAAIREGPAMMANASRVTEAALGGWTLAGITTFQHGMALQFRADAFNSMNTPHFSSPGTTCCCTAQSSAFGVITKVVPVVKTIFTRHPKTPKTPKLTRTSGSAIL